MTIARFPINQPIFEIFESELRKSTEQNTAESSYVLGLFLLEKSSASSEPALVLHEAFPWFQHAASNNFLDAPIYCAKLIEWKIITSQQSIPTDNPYAHALFWLDKLLLNFPQKMAEYTIELYEKCQQSLVAQRKLALATLFIKKDVSKGLTLLKKCVDAKDKEAAAFFTLLVVLAKDINFSEQNAKKQIAADPIYNMVANQKLLDSLKLYDHPKFQPIIKQTIESVHADVGEEDHPNIPVYIYDLCRAKFSRLSAIELGKTTPVEKKEDVLITPLEVYLKKIADRSPQDQYQHGLYSLSKFLQTHRMDYLEQARQLMEKAGSKNHPSAILYYALILSYADHYKNSADHSLLDHLISLSHEVKYEIFRWFTISDWLKNPDAWRESGSFLVVSQLNVSTGLMALKPCADQSKPIDAAARLILGILIHLAKKVNYSLEEVQIRVELSKQIEGFSSCYQLINHEELLAQLKNFEREEFEDYVENLLKQAPTQIPLLSPHYEIYNEALLEIQKKEHELEHDVIHHLKKCYSYAIQAANPDEIKEVEAFKKAELTRLFTLFKPKQPEAAKEAIAEVKSLRAKVWETSAKTTHLVLEKVPTLKVLPKVLPPPPAGEDSFDEKGDLPKLSTEMMRSAQQVSKIIADKFHMKTPAKSSQFFAGAGDAKPSLERKGATQARQP